jgi:hypothetical protein
LAEALPFTVTFVRRFECASGTGCQRAAISPPGAGMAT